MNCHVCGKQPSNYHTKKKGQEEEKVPIIDIEQKGEFDNRGCMDLDTNVCKVRFPKDIYSETAVDPETGALLMKKEEAWLNTFTPAVFYMLRCNHNVTSLLSDITIKSVVAYVAYYMIKTPTQNS